MRLTPLAVLVGLSAAFGACSTSEPDAVTESTDTTNTPDATDPPVVPGDPIDATPAQCSNDQIAGEWDVTITGFGTSVWTLEAHNDSEYLTTERGLGSSTGRILHTTHILGQQLPTPLLTGTWETSDSAGTLQWTLTEDCRQGSGTVEFTTHHNEPANDVYDTTIHRRTN